MNASLTTTLHILPDEPLFHHKHIINVLLAFTILLPARYITYSLKIAVTTRHDMPHQVLLK
jgi:hypothetical protein